MAKIMAWVVWFFVIASFVQKVAEHFELGFWAALATVVVMLIVCVVFKIGIEL